MNCAEFRPLVDELIDGALSRRSHEEARRHAGTCPSCREMLEGTRRLVEAAAELPVEVEPSRDLWEGVEAGIRSSPGGAAGAQDQPLFVRAVDEKGERRTGRTAWHAGLAAALVLVVAGAGLVASLMLRPAAVDRPGETRMNAEAPVRATGAGRGEGLDEASRAFLEAKRALRAAFDRQQGALSPRTVRKVEENLKIIEEAVAEIQAELGKDPGNPQLERMLVAAQQREVALLRKVTKTAVLHQR